MENINIEGLLYSFKSTLQCYADQRTKIQEREQDTAFFDGYVASLTSVVNILEALRDA